jgi:predicted NBD/HSP70 family sugar kinase
MGDVIFDASLTSAIKSLLDQYGVTGDVSVATPLTADEALFVVSTEGAANMNERALTEALTRLLGRKVWVATNGARWRGRTVPLE